MLIQQRGDTVTLTTESVAYWFFRLNGCLTITDFVVHPDPVDHHRQAGQRTDADILAVRFPYRAEFFHTNQGAPMEDHQSLTPDGVRIDVIIAEVKASRCKLNGPWTNPARENMQRVLYAIGPFVQASVPTIADALYRDFIYRDEEFRVRLFAIGNAKSAKLHSSVVQMTWNDILGFIYQRFSIYQRVKADHSHWDDAGKYLYRKFERHYPSLSQFKATVLEELEVSVPNLAFEEPDALRGENLGADGT